VLKFHFIAIACPSHLLRNEAGSTPWPENICAIRPISIVFFGGCNNTIHNHSGTNSYTTNSIWYLTLSVFYDLFYCILISAFRWLKYEIGRHLLLISAAILVASHQRNAKGWTLITKMLHSSNIPRIWSKLMDVWRTVLHVDSIIGHLHYNSPPFTVHKRMSTTSHRN